MKATKRSFRFSQNNESNVKALKLSQQNWERMLKDLKKVVETSGNPPIPLNA